MKTMNGTHIFLVRGVDNSGNSTSKRITVTTSNSGQVQMEQELLALINLDRQQTGIQPVVFNSKLLTAARTHSKDMATVNYLGHIGSDGSTLGQRLTAAGYPWISGRKPCSRTDRGAICL
jgi:uncharacterized protein YkwD